MSEIMRPLPFSALAEHALCEYAKGGSIFGIRQNKFYRNDGEVKVKLWGNAIDSPIGPAAGPNSQLAQNIIAAYLAGSRFIELKTVQTMDGEELRNCVPRPCINAEDECYNVEWSTELTVGQAFDEYVKAWFLVHVLGKEFGLGTGILFNMSVGYSLEGIQSKKIDDYIEGLKSASGTAVWKECYSWLKENIGRFEHFGQQDLDEISDSVSTSITLSTLHGCPREEIEKIAYYLLTEKHIHTYIKCNPTLLGYQEARRILDNMGYEYVSFDEHHFVEDLQFDDAVGMLTRLKKTAADLGLALGVKITNTFPVEIKKEELPGEEMYMAGRALFPLSINVAYRLSKAFDGTLPISYSGGLDRFNIARILETGIRPVTMATTILKPGGYERMKQLAEIAEEAVDQKQDHIDIKKLAAIAENTTSFERHLKSYRETAGRKTENPLGLSDCAEAPCSGSGCPINQQIPAYLEQVAKGDFAKAFAIIANDNPLPSITGTICDHQCQSKCTRLDYEDPIQIRNAKKRASVQSQRGYTENINIPQVKSDKKVLIIGAGPAGVAAAVYLTRNNVDVTVRERFDKPLGIVSHVIPAFRITDAEIALDAAMAEAYGAVFEYNAPEEYNLNELKKEYDYIIIATGAWKEGKGPLPVNGENTIDALAFLAESRSSELTLDIGKRVAVIGGGDVAMDCARAAARNEGNPETVILYRRTKEFMPAQPEEIRLAEEDGVLFQELMSPVSFENGILTCEKMELGDVDFSGRRSVLSTGKTETLAFDTVISAVGAGVDTSLFNRNAVKLTDRGAVIINDSRETSISGVYTIGDCKAGPKTVVLAMADAKAAAKDILNKLGLDNDFVSYPIETCREDLIAKKGLLESKSSEAEDAARCLSCGKVCEICADVCPNRANIVIDTGDDFRQRYQVIHIDAMCNECGNCGIFCPSNGNPCKDKFTLFLTGDDLIDSENRGFSKIGEDRYKVRLEDGSVTEGKIGEGIFPASYEKFMKTITEAYSYL